MAWIRIAQYALVAIATVTTPAVAAEKELNRTFEVPAGGRLTVEVDGGSINVRGTDAQQVVVKMRARGSEEQLERTKLSAERTAEGVTVTSKRNRDGSGWDQSEGVHVSVEVPRSYHLALQTAGGHIELRRIDGRVNGRTSGGHITVEDVTGELTMRTSGGAINLKNVKGPTDIATSGGSIQALHVAGKLSAHTNGGSIRLEKISGAIEARTNGGSIDLELDGANEGIVASTNAGSITLRIPSTTNANVNASASVGGVKSELPIAVTQTNKHTLRGTLNGGGPEIVARTHAGSIAIRSGS